MDSVPNTGGDALELAAAVMAIPANPASSRGWIAPVDRQIHRCCRIGREADRSIRFIWHRISVRQCRFGQA